MILFKHRIGCLTFLALTAILVGAVEVSEQKSAEHAEHHGQVSITEHQDVQQHQEGTEHQHSGTDHQHSEHADHKTNEEHSTKDKENAEHIDKKQSERSGQNNKTQGKSAKGSSDLDRSVTKLQLLVNYSLHALTASISNCSNMSQADASAQLKKWYCYKNASQDIHQWMMTIASTEATYNTYNITFHFYIVKIECKLKKTEEPKENINRYDPRQDRNSIDFMTYTKRNASINTKMKNCQISISSTPEVCLQDLLDNLKDELDTIVEAQKFIDNIFEPESKKLLQEVAKEQEALIQRSRPNLDHFESKAQTV